MATSLAAQLNQLKTPQTSSLVNDKRKPSLLFDTKEAAKLDKEVVFQIGQKGLQELISMRYSFKEFEISLFAPSSMNYQRLIRTANENEKLDQEINKFFMLLSPYFLINSAHKALEWLIYRFQIHKYNKDQLILLILPYHETKMFVRALQLVDVSSPSDIWHWLSPLQKSGKALPLSSLTKQLCSEPALIKIICNHVIKATDVNGPKAESLGTLYGLYLQCLVGFLELCKTINDNHINYFLPSLKDGLDSSISIYNASVYMIIAKLVTKVTLAEHSMNRIQRRILKDPNLKDEALLLIIILYENPYNPVQEVSEKTLLKITNLDWFIGTLEKIRSSEIRTTKFLCSFLKSAFNFIINDSRKMEEERRKEDVLRIQKMLIEIFDWLALVDEEVQFILNFATQEDLSSIHDDDKYFFKGIFAKIEVRYSERFDGFLKDLIHQTSKEDADSHKALKFLMTWHEMESSYDFISRLGHYNPEQRAIALKIFAEKPVKITSTIKESLRSLLLLRFEDPEVEVLNALLKVPVQKLLDLIGREVLIEKLLIILASCYVISRKLLALPALKIALQLCDRNSTQVFLTTLPYVFPRSEEDIKITVEVLNSQFAGTNKFLESMKAELHQMGNFDSDAVCKVAFHCILNKELLPPVEDIISSMKGKMMYSDAASLFLDMIVLGSVCRVKGGVSTDTAMEIVDIIIQMLKVHEKIKPLDDYLINGENIKKGLFLAEKGTLPLQASSYVLATIYRNLNIQTNSLIDFENDPSRSRLILRLLETFFFCRANKVWSDHYDKCLDLFFKVNLYSVEKKLRFQSSFFVPPVSCQTSLEFLRMAYAIVNNEKSIKWIFRDEIFIPNLLVSLSSENVQCREASVKLLKKLVSKSRVEIEISDDKSSTKKEMDAIFALLDELTNGAYQIAMDHQQLGLALYSLLSPDPHVAQQLKVKLRAKMAEARNFLFGIIVAKGTPVHLKSQLLKILEHVNSKEIIKSLTPLGRQMMTEYQKKFSKDVLVDIVKRFTSNCVDALMDVEVRKFFMDCLEDSTRDIGVEKPQLMCVLAVKQIDATFFANLGKISPAQQMALFKKIVETAATCEAALSTTIRALRNIQVDARLLVSELGAMKKAFAMNVHNQNSEETKKRGIILLEFAQDADNLENTHFLVPVLFDLLEICLKIEEQTEVEYVNQLILSTLYSLATKNIGDFKNNPHLYIGAIAHCMRISHNPQTHHHALLLLVELFRIAETQSALNQVMPVFTFMGSSVLRQDDAYSIQIICKTIETILPVVNTTNDPKHACEILRIFVASLPDVPEHRRSPLFSKLLQLLSNYLHLFFLLSFESQVAPAPTSKGQNLSSISKNQTLPRLSTFEKFEFNLKMALLFSPRKLLATCGELLEFFEALFAVNLSGDSKKSRSHGSFRYNYIFDLEKHSPKTTRHMKYVILQFLNIFLSSQEFINRIAALNSAEIEEIRPLFDDLLKRLVLLIQSTSKKEEFVSTSHPRHAYFKALLSNLYDLLNLVNNLLPNNIFLEIVRDSLLKQDIFVVRRKVLDLLNARLQQKMFHKEDFEILLGLLRPLLKVFDGPNKYISQELEIVQQTSLMTIKLIAKLMAIKHKDPFIPVLDMTTEIVKKRDGPVLASAVLCVAELCSTLGPYAVKSLNKIFPAILGLLDTHCSQTIPDITAISIVSALLKIVESIGNFISKGDLTKLLIKLCKLCSIYTETQNSKVELILPRIKLISKNLSSHIALRVLLPAVDEVYMTFLKNKSVLCVKPLMEILTDAFTDITTANLNLLLSNPKEFDLTMFFLKVLDFRSDIDLDNEMNEDVVDLQGIIDVEESTSKALVTLVLKMSETTFRPFYYKLYDWAARNPEHLHRNITFYRLSANIAECLKSLFVLFAGHFVKHAATLLKSCNDAIDDEKDDKISSLDKSYKKELIEAILLTLSRSFSYDSHDFMNQERFDILMTPLVDQIENTLGSKSEYQKRARELIVPCIASFAGVISEDSFHKQLVYHVLLKTKHEKVHVRAAALNALVEIVRKLGEDFMPILPDLIPVLSELLEDEEMEQQAQEAVRTVEELLGEKLENYL